MTTHDKWYNKWSKDTTSNACVVRITNKCDQKCMHCCFRSDPSNIDQMSVDMCEQINAWVPKGIILNIMGGEFSVLSNYPKMLVALANGRNSIRLVTNGFWAYRATDKFFNTINQIKAASCQNIDVVISQDGWHEKPSHRAEHLLETNNHGINLIRTGDLSINDITPVGRAWDNNILPRSNICRSCEYMCNMTITEDGMLCRCPFGYFPWKNFNYTTWYDAQEYIWGWRSEKLSEGMNCHLCMETVKAAQTKEY